MNINNKEIDALTRQAKELSDIGFVVEDLIIKHKSTTLDAVRYLKAEYDILSAEKVKKEIEAKKTGYP